MLTLTACEQPDPNIECRTPTPTSIPGLPADGTQTPPADGTQTSPADGTQTSPAEPATTPTWPSYEPIPPTGTPPAPTNSPPTESPPPPIDPLGTPFRDPHTGKAVLPSRFVTFNEHPTEHGQGIDLVPETKRKGGSDARGFHVTALRSGLIYNNLPEYEIGPNIITIQPVDKTYEVIYSHIIPAPKFTNVNAHMVNAGDFIGTIMDITEDTYAAVRSDDDHLHLGYREPIGNNPTDPSFLIPVWGPEGLSP